MKRLHLLIWVFTCLLINSGCKKKIESNGLIEAELRAAAKTETFQFVIPTEFKGLIQITENKDTGQKLHLLNNTRTIQVPADGKVEVVSVSLFERWKKEIAIYSDGTKIPNPYETYGEFPRQKVAFYNCGSSLEGEPSKLILKYFLGSKEEMDNYK